MLLIWSFRTQRLLRGPADDECDSFHLRCRPPVGIEYKTGAYPHHAIAGERGVTLSVNFDMLAIGLGCVVQREGVAS
jgi:hypothetical protein